MNPEPRAPALGRLSSIAAHTLAAALAIATLSAAPIHAQTLARPGWVGSGLNTDPWWQHAVFYEIHGPDYKAVAARLDALRALGVDAVLVPAPTLPAQASSAPDSALDDFDELIHQASRTGIRVLLTLPAASPTQDISGLARLWLSRGVAGFRLVTPSGTNPQDAQAIAQNLRKLTASAVGQRIVLSSFDPNSVAVAPQPIRRSSTSRTPRPADATGAELQIDSRPGRIAPDAASLRPFLAQTLSQPNLILDFQSPLPSPSSPASNPALANIIAAILLTTHSAALIDASQTLILKPDAAPAAEPAPPTPPSAPAHPNSTFTIVNPSAPTHAAKPPTPTPQTLAALALTDWYRQLAVLHHGNAALRFGNTSFLDFDQQNALVWVARPATNSRLTPPVVVLCNLSASPVRLPLAPALRAMNLHGDYLRTLLRSDKAMGPQDLDAVLLPPYSVYIGELRR